VKLCDADTDVRWSARRDLMVVAEVLRFGQSRAGRNPRPQIWAAWSRVSLVPMFPRRDVEKVCVSLILMFPRRDPETARGAVVRHVNVFPVRAQRATEFEAEVLASHDTRLLERVVDPGVLSVLMFPRRDSKKAHSKTVRCNSALPMLALGSSSLEKDTDELKEQFMIGLPLGEAQGDLGFADARFRSPQGAAVLLKHGRTQPRRPGHEPASIAAN